MGSKSSSKSILPKGVTFVHVLLAIVAGLVICSMMSGSVVEGQGDGLCAPEPTLAATAPGKVLFAKNPNLCSKHLTDDTCTEGGACLWTATPHSTTGAGKKKVPLADIVNATTGYCAGKASASQNDLCNKFTDPKKCDTDSGGVCKFRKADDIYSYSGGLEGNIYNEWMRALNLVDSKGERTAASLKTVPNEAASSGGISTQLLPLRLEGSDQWPGTEGDAKGKHNFLTHLDVKKASEVEKSKKIPKELKDTVKAYVSDCESGWPKDLYGDNGTRPIMGYSRESGLVCKNPFYKPSREPGTVPRAFKGEGCPDPTKACDTFSSPCNWGPSDGNVSAVTNFVHNNAPFTNSGPCALPACRAEYAGQCAKETVVDTIGDATGWFDRGWKNLFKRTDIDP
jgi:hypothetical protein